MSVTAFGTIIDARGIGNQHLITNESHVIPSSVAYVIYLAEVPLRSLPTYYVTISGYTEVTTAPTTTQFLVNYQLGTITFNSAAAGVTVLVTYWGTGSVLAAHDVNNLHTAVNNLETMIFPVIMPDGTLQLKPFTNATETTLVSGYTTAEAGRVWFNTETGNFKGWNGTTIVVTG